jgi:hypothetical protein
VTNIATIADGTDVSSIASMNAAKKELAKLSDFELYVYLVQKETINATTPTTRRRITFAQMEFDRRNAESTKSTTFKANLLSAGIGVGGVILGFILSTFVKPDEPTAWQVKFTPAAVEQTVTATPLKR